MFARTERLLLRPGFPEDAPALLRAIGDDLIVRQVADGKWPSTLEEAANLIESESSSELPNLLIFRRTGGAPRLVGAAGLKREWTGEIELWLWITREHWGLGFATEASKAMLALARDSMRLDCIVGGHFVDSPAGGRVLRKLGFEPTLRCSA